MGGSLITQGNNIGKPISLTISDATVGKLGAWTLVDQPEIYIPAYWEKPTSLATGYCTFYMNGIDGYYVEKILNPELSGIVTSSSLRFYLYETTRNLSQYDRGPAGGGNREYSQMDVSTLALPVPLYGDIYAPTFNQALMAYIDYPDDYVQASKWITDIDSKYIMVVELTLNTSINGVTDEVVISHTFVPKVKWGPYPYGFKMMNCYPENVVK